MSMSFLKDRYGQYQANRTDYFPLMIDNTVWLVDSTLYGNYFLTFKKYKLKILALSYEKLNNVIYIYLQFYLFLFNNYIFFMYLSIFRR